MMELIDTHCHLNVLDSAPTDELIRRAAEVHVTRMICIGASEGIASATAAVELANRYPSVWATVGVHPHSAGSYTDLQALEPLLQHPKVVAIGETGLDFFREWAPFENQRKLFAASIAAAKNFNKPLVIHCRDAEAETYEMLKSLGAGDVGGVVHCFGGDLTFAKKMFDLNFLVSFTGTITFKSATALRETVQAVPLEKLMLETDAPYMAPEPFRGKPSEPMHVWQIARRLAEIKGTTIEEVARITTTNALRLFGPMDLPATEVTTA